MESAIFANQMKFEKTKNNEKKKVTNNSRDNYAEYNRSSIFTPIIPIVNFWLRLECIDNRRNSKT